MKILNVSQISWPEEFRVNEVIKTLAEKGGGRDAASVDYRVMDIAKKRSDLSRISEPDVFV